MSKKEAKAQRERILKDARAMAGIERAEILARGGNNAAIWRSGGIRTGAHKDLRKEAARRACRDWK